MNFKHHWFFYALTTTIFWGVWGAIIEIPEKNGFPATMGYIAWAATMVPCSLIALKIIQWKFDHDLQSIIMGLIVGLAGAGGQLVLFQALREGPAYLIFPIVSLYPVLTIILSMTFLKETATRKQYIGIFLALVAIFLLSYSDGQVANTTTYLWLILSSCVFLLWGLQAFVMKFSNETMRAESIFFYMMLSAVALTPVAYGMTETDTPINYGLSGGLMALMFHFLNSIGALTLVYALRYGKAIIVVPLTGLAPVITIILSLFIYNVWPEIWLQIGMTAAVISIYLISD